MPAFSVNTPTVQVSIPVPGPANTGPKPAPKPKPAPAPQPVAVAPVDPRAGGPRAVIMPHATPPRRMARTGPVRRYSSYTHADFHRKMRENPQERGTVLAYSDWLEENGMPTVASVLRDHVQGEESPFFTGDPPLGSRSREFQATLHKHTGKPSFYAILNQREAAHPHAGFQWFRSDIPEADYESFYHALESEGVHVVPYRPLQTPRRMRRRVVRYATPPQQARADRDIFHANLATLRSRIEEGWGEGNPDSEAALDSRERIADHLESVGDPLAHVFRNHTAAINPGLFPGDADNSRLRVIAKSPRFYIQPARRLVYAIHPQTHNGVSLPYPVVTVWERGTDPDGYKDFHFPLATAPVDRETLHAIIDKYGVHGPGTMGEAERVVRSVANQHGENAPEPPRRMARPGKPRRYSHDEAAGFVRKMAEEPAERTTPLVFADWLQDNGHPDIAAVIRKSMDEKEPHHNAVFTFCPAAWTGFNIPSRAQVGQPHAFTPVVPPNGVRSRDPDVGVGVLYADPSGGPHHLYFGSNFPVAEAWRMFHRMRDAGVVNADRAIQNLARRYPDAMLNPPEKLARAGRPRHLARRQLRRP